MDDFERYGDYNEVEDAPKKSTGLKIIKAVAIVVCFSVIGLLAFRVFSFNFYPDAMKRVTFTDTLSSYYSERDGELEVLTQTLRTPYDDADKGNFFCDHLRIVKDAGYLQITVRYNESLRRVLLENYGTEVDIEDKTVFSFRLYKSGEGGEVGRLVYTEWDSFMMYRYCKLVFEDVDFGTETDPVNWIRLEIMIDGVQYTDKADNTKKDKVFMIPVYENNENYSKFSEYKLSSGEVPR
ncbi:MAG: hypothetical protein J6Q85_06580 [Clostridia bacterium]|nr:hypothetical protein [Clostridia bacterium]